MDAKDQQGQDFLYTLAAFAVLALAAIPVGIAVFVLGFVHGDSPCVLCWEQRIGMVIIALIGLFLLRYGARPFYLGLGLLVGLGGMYMGLRHSALHLARDIGQGFSIEIAGAHTYVWSFFIFLCCTVAIAACIMAARPQLFMDAAAPRRLSGLDRLAFVVFLVVVAANVVQAFASSGPPPYVASGDPVRFSFNPRHWAWTMAEYTAGPISWRGSWAVEKPDVAVADPDPATGPLTGLAPVAVESRRKLELPLGGTPTGLAYDAATDRFLVTTERGLYVTDAALQKIERHTVVDPMYSVDLARFVDGAFLDERRVLAISDNKSFVVLRETERGSTGGADRNFPFFLESYDDFDEVNRSRLATVRAKMLYVMACAYDPATKSLFTLTVPNAVHQRLVVSRFDMADMTLSEEFVPAIVNGVTFAPRQGGPGLEKLYVTAATVAEGRLYALSAAHATLITIDLASRAVVDAWTVPGLVRPVGMAIRDGRFHVVSADGELLIISPR